MLLPAWALAQSVTLSGMMGSRALLIVDGSAPKSVAPGEVFQGVKLVSTSGDQAVVEVQGQRQTLRLGDAPASVGARREASAGQRIVMTAGSGGHFITLGQINGRSIQMLVDTGASLVVIGASDAERLGIKYRDAPSVSMGTANGMTQAWRVRLNSLRVGDVEVFDVEALVARESMPFALLGNSFLTRFQMRRENDQLTLERRY